MSRPIADPILAAILSATVEATGATQGLLLRAEGRVLRVVAIAGTVPWDVLGEPISAGEGVAGYVAAAGQALALSSTSADPRLGEGTASLLGHNPSSVLAVPVEADGRVVGVLELLGAPEGAFGVADTEQATIQAGVAATALTDERLSGTAAVAEPAELAADLRRLAATDQARYAMVATILEALMR